MRREVDCYCGIKEFYRKVMSTFLSSMVSWAMTNDDLYLNGWREISFHDC
jgi:hypothetical protein